ncbi:hypothetical protein M0R45_036103 [Rubus argutus]|uniref:Uncharacterized protein n=1 Tax=Rubus argutus TaxID=59490 RepID=A0AAW1VZM6_RUBAR
MGCSSRLWRPQQTTVASTFTAPFYLTHQLHHYHFTPSPIPTTCNLTKICNYPNLSTRPHHHHHNHHPRPLLPAPISNSSPNHHQPISQFHKSQTTINPSANSTNHKPPNPNQQPHIHQPNSSPLLIAATPTANLLHHIATPRGLPYQPRVGNKEERREDGEREWRWHRPEMKRRENRKRAGRRDATQEEKKGRKEK